MNPLQQASVRRKIYYFVAIIALFTLSMFWRGMISIPLAGKAQAADWVASKTILNQAQRMEMRELEQGDPEIAGTAIRLLLTGSRGFAVTSLWLSAIDKQKRNDFHEFELRVRAVTKLQPNFITPWIYQSWNITYNVSVEQDKLNDMYFYIARGIELLAEGERRNKRSPDMRHQIGFYYQNKFGVSDKVQTLRALYQLSCIPPAERDPNKFKNPDGSVNLAVFKQFCEQYPHLVRRLRERVQVSGTEENKRKISYSTPETVVDFLAFNQKVPTRYKNAVDLAPGQQQFPALPPKLNELEGEANPETEYGDDFSAFGASRAWFAYSCLVVPPNPKDEQGRPIPGPTPRPGEYDSFKYRVPRLPMLIIFRQYPARSQSYQAEMEQKEGWYDAEGWRVDQGVDPANRWFPNEDVVIGGTGRRKTSEEQWREAALLWRKHGEDYALILSTERFEQLKTLAGDTSTLPPEPTPELLANPAMRQRYMATASLFYYSQNRQVTNFPYFLAQAEAEAKKETVVARKILGKAEQARKSGNKLEAIALYEDGLRKWGEVLVNNPDFHRPSERSDRTEEETYEYEYEYLKLIVQDDQRVRTRVREIGGALRAVIPMLPEVAVDSPLWKADARDELTWHVAERQFSPFGGLMATNDTRNGGPWVRNDVKESVRVRQGVMRKERPPPNIVPVGGPPAPPGG